MKPNKKKRQKNSGSKKRDQMSVNKSKIVEFNLSRDNIKCFIDEKHPKTDRKRPSYKEYVNYTDTKKNIERAFSMAQQQKKTRKQSCSPDPSRQASNQIIQKIQKNGLNCVWNDIQQVKTEYSNQEEWRQNEILQQTFSQCSSSVGKNHSHASTIDRFSGYYNPRLKYSSSQCQIVGQFMNVPLATSQYIMQLNQRNRPEFTFQINVQYICNDPRTTLMIRNIPNKYTIQDLSHEIDRDHQNTYDFLYLPCDIKNNCNVGYGFINFVNTEVLLHFYNNFHNQKWLKFRSQKICVLAYARLQGLSNLIDHFQNSKVLNNKDKRYQPIIKQARKQLEDLIQQQKYQQSILRK